MPRKTRFETHIRPMFREIDRRHMMRHDGRDLWDASQVAQRGLQILNWLERQHDPMPPTMQGGPWPAEWISLFYRWILEGCPTLDLAEGTYSAERRGGYVTVHADVPLPNSNEAVWFEHFVSGPIPADLVIYREPPEIPDRIPTVLVVNDAFELPASVTSLIILDLNGAQTVTIIPDDATGS